MFNPIKHRVFVCTKQRDPNNAEGCCFNCGGNAEGCCFNCGGVEIYQAFLAEIEQRQLEDRVEIRGTEQKKGDCYNRVLAYIRTK